jgi:hypothetical protein
MLASDDAALPAWALAVRRAANADRLRRALIVAVGALLAVPVASGAVEPGVRCEPARRHSRHLRPVAFVIR